MIQKLAAKKAKTPPISNTKRSPIKQTKKKSRRTTAGTIFYITFCLSILIIGSAWSFINKSKLILTISRQALLNSKPQGFFNDRGNLTVLLLGCDEERAPGGKRITVKEARSDTILVAKFDFKDKTITGVSIPRDLIIQLPGYKSHKINAYHKIGGKQLAKQAVEYVIRHPIDKVIVVNEYNMQDLVNMVGGIEIDVPKRMKWTDRAGGLYIDLKPGVQKLDGYNAMCFVRYRHSDSDWHRQQRQKQFLMAFKDTVVKQPNLLPALADKAKEIVGDELTMDQMAALALFGMKIGNQNIQMGVIPTVVAGHYYLRLDETRLSKTLRQYGFANNEPTNA